MGDGNRIAIQDGDEDMRFVAFKEFRGLINTGIEDIVEYLRTDMKKVLRELQLGLTKLSLLDNFEGFSAEVTIAAGAELAIQNQFRNGKIPSQRIIVKGGSGSQNIVDGDTAWSVDFVYLKNTGASSASATVIFLK